MQELAGKIALVTGAARRVGRAIARACADAGAEVAVHHRSSRGPAEELCAEIAASGRRASAFSVVFLAAQDYVSGAVPPVDGGWSVPR